MGFSRCVLDFGLGGCVCLVCGWCYGFGVAAFGWVLLIVVMLRCVAVCFSADYIACLACSVLWML